MQLADLQTSCECTPDYEARKGLHTRIVKIDPHKYFHLEQPYNNYISNIYKKQLFSYCKTDALKITVLAFSNKKPYNKLRLSESLTFQNLLKNTKLLLGEKFENILGFDKESKTQLIRRQFY